MIFSSRIAWGLAAVLPQWMHSGSRSDLADLGKTLDELRERWQVQGIAATVVQHPNYTKSGDWSVDTYALGERDRRGKPVRQDTLFEVASNSKLFAALATGLLVHNDSLSPRLSWDSKVASVIPDWQLVDPVAAQEADLLDILSHRSGLPRHEFMYESSWTSLEYLQKLRHVRPSTGFRQQYQYTNLHYVAASLLPEAMLDVPYWDFVQENILNPLGMSLTTYDLTSATESGRRADGNIRQGRNMTRCAEFLQGLDWSKIPQDRDFKVDPSCMGDRKSIGWPTRGEAPSQAGPGGVITCARDMAIWLKMLLLKGKDPRTGKQVIPAAVIDEVAKGRTVPSGETSWPEESVITYGMGQQRYHYRGHEVIEHFGGDPGFNSVVSRMPDIGLGVAIMTNDDVYGTPFHMIAKYRIFDAMLGLEPIKWEERLAKTMIGVVPAERTRPERPAPPPHGFGPLAGTYHHAAYGRVTLCPVPSTMPAPSTAEDLPLPPGCEAILASQPFPLADLAGPTFVAAVNKTWITHLALTHHSGAIFDFTTATVYPETGLVSLAFEPSYERVYAQFDGAGEGFGMGGGFWGAARGIADGDIAREGLRAGAEVYFERVG